MPLRVVKPGAPAVIGTVRAVLPLMSTFIWWLATLTVLMIESPTLNETWRFSWP